MNVKKLLKIIFIGLLLLMSPPEIVYGCIPPSSWEIFLSGGRFLIGEVVDIQDSEISIYVTDSFAANSENGTFAISEIIDFINVDILGYPQPTERFEVGDAVVASFEGFEGPEFCDANGQALFHVTSLDYAHLQVGDHSSIITEILTSFVNQRGTYTYHYSRNRGIIYRQNRENSTGFTVYIDETSLILGSIVTLDDEEVIIKVWDYVISNDNESAPEYLTYQIRHERRFFDEFDIGDDIAIRGPLSNRLRPTYISADIFSVHILDDMIQLVDVRGDDSVSALYTDLLQHRNPDAYVFNFGRSTVNSYGERQSSRYGLIERLVDGERIVIYKQEVEIEDEDEDDSERLPIALIMVIGTGSVLGISIIFLVLGKRKKLSAVELV